MRGLKDPLKLVGCTNLWQMAASSACTGRHVHVSECVHADGHGDADVVTHHCLWSHLPAEPVPAQQLWAPLLPLLLVPAGDGFVCFLVLHPHPQSEPITHDGWLCLLHVSVDFAHIEMLLFEFLLSLPLFLPVCHLLSHGLASSASEHNFLY